MDSNTHFREKVGNRHADSRDSCAAQACFSRVQRA